MSECQTANDILFWLLEWKRTGAAPPREAVCHSSKALLNALINAFTRCKTISEYADACKNGPLPDCYTRIDVAHTIKIYSDFLRGRDSAFRNLYLGALGLLILAESYEEAEKILSLKLIVSRSPQKTPGSACLTAKENLKSKLIKDPGSGIFTTGNDEVDESLNGTRIFNQGAHFFTYK